MPCKTPHQWKTSVIIVSDVDLSCLQLYDEAEAVLNKPSQPVPVDPEES